MRNTLCKERIVGNGGINWTEGPNRRSVVALPEARIRDIRKEHGKGTVTAFFVDN